mmetsp:Transcript_30710/g.45453  ORF Transcript_30710/g.45453 Transcript_30710/m.45453 type:complete len:85 (-) Transcript_30710:756-1010(-)
MFIFQATWSLADFKGMSSIALFEKNQVIVDFSEFDLFILPVGIIFSSRLPSIDQALRSSIDFVVFEGGPQRICHTRNFHPVRFH